MKNILAAAAIALLCILTPAQEAPPAKPETGENTPAKQAPVKTGDGSKTATLDPAKIESGIRQNDFLRKPIGTEQSTSVDLKKLEAAMNVTPPEPTEPALNKIEKNDKSFHWKPALVQSGLFLAIQHGFRMTEEKTRSELDGPFFSDWKDSVKNLKGWDDGGKVFTNYVAHPMQGAITSRIFLNNSGKARLVEFGGSKVYWESRMKAMAWSALWSLQFEIGPLSESSLGNVGQKLHANGK
ncbi:MAG: hypothetical protein ACJ72Z_07835, partial [Pyrinomonadaceae bacterium]